MHNLFTAVNELSKLKQIPKDKLKEIIKSSLQMAVSRKYKDLISVDVSFEPDDNILEVRVEKQVVEVVNDSIREISVEDAQEVNPGIDEGDRIWLDIPIQDLGRKTVQSTKAKILQEIKSLESEKIFSDYSNLQGEIVSGSIDRVEDNGYVMDIGRIEAYLPNYETSPNEFFVKGNHIKAYVSQVKRHGGKGHQVILSRIHPNFVKELFRSEIPEIHKGIVEIKDIVRDPGVRTKIAVVSHDPNVDAFGTCVGNKGVRVQNIRKELREELVDVVRWSENIEDYIAESLGRDKVLNIFIDDKMKTATVLVLPEKKNIAIGKSGKNVRLAAILTKHKIDILTEEEYLEKKSLERRITTRVDELDGVTPKISEALKEAGHTSVEDIFKAKLEDLQQLPGIGEKTAIKLKDAAKRF